MAGMAVAAMALSGGCQQGHAPRVADDTELVTTLGLDVQDVERFAAELAESLIDSDVLGGPEGPSVVVVERFVNNTSETRIDRDRVLGRVLIALNRSDTAVAYMGGTTRGEGESGLATDEARIRAEAEGIRREYDYSVIVKLYEDRAQLGRTRQASFIVQLSLIDLDRSVEVWREERRITKQARQAAVGL